MPWRICEKNGFEMSGTVTSSLRVRSVRRLLAAEFGVEPRASTARCTRWRVAGATTAGWVSTRETVAVETPARLATWWIVGCGRAGIKGSSGEEGGILAAPRDENPNTNVACTPNRSRRHRPRHPAESVAAREAGCAHRAPGLSVQRRAHHRPGGDRRQIGRA